MPGVSAREESCLALRPCHHRLRRRCAGSDRPAIQCHVRATWRPAHPFPSGGGSERGQAPVPKNKMGAGVATGPHLSRVRTAAPVRAWRLSRAVLNSLGASSSGIRGSGRGLATSVGSLRTPDRRTCRSSVCGSFGRSLRFRWSFEEIGIGLRLTLLLRWSIHRFGGLRSEDRCPLPRWPRFRTFLPCGRSVPHREMSQWPSLPSRAKRNIGPLACG